MENCYAVRVSYPYVMEDLSQEFRDAQRFITDLDEQRHLNWRSVRSIVAVWATHVQRMVVYEHNDDGANRVHCHIMIEGSRISKKRLQQLAGEVCHTTAHNPGHRKSSLMSFRTKEYDGNIAGYAYVTKGKYDPKYIQGWTAEEAQGWKEAWVAPAEHQKRTTWRVLLDEFMSWSNDKSNRLDFDVEITTNLLLLRVRQFLLQRHQGLYPPQAKTERWFLVTNLCFQYRLPFPPMWKE